MLHVYYCKLLVPLHSFEWCWHVKNRHSYFFCGPNHQLPSWWVFFSCGMHSPGNTLDMFMGKPWKAIQTLIWIQISQNCPKNIQQSYVCSATVRICFRRWRATKIICLNSYLNHNSVWMCNAKLETAISGQYFIQDDNFRCFALVARTALISH